MNNNDKLTRLIRERVIELVDTYLKGEIGIKELSKKIAKANGDKSICPLEIAKKNREYCRTFDSSQEQ